ncbi:MAG: YeeE/YedE family protein [Hydrogenobacter thermophilus]|uniref:YeeE/YedE thiosulfate transporter family protein n=1 Tax=Hydrogenobacter thermophilus TaxID=940 RepID=UPI001C7418BF|nr:YeeE/YedE thiosulfate transporter family protein [Hydrogenobacter thermophilus]QWK19329.1 MAG: YeeE/YedE family protein [Hydrogenobacter thermophilus]
MRELTLQQVPLRHKTYAWLIIILSVLISSLAMFVDIRFSYMVAYFWAGIVYGLFLQYGHFCMASATRDLFAIGTTRVAVGILIAITLYGFTSLIDRLIGIAPFHANPIGIHTLIGGLIFGIGISFAGGCSSGSLYKSGEGNIAAMIVVTSVAVAQALFVSTLKFPFVPYLVPQSWVRAANQQIDMGMPKEFISSWYDYFLAGYAWNLKGLSGADLIPSDNTPVREILGNFLLGVILPTLFFLIITYALFFRKRFLRSVKDRRFLITDMKGLFAMITDSKRTALAGLGLGVASGLHMWVLGLLRERFNIDNFGELLQQMGFTSGLTIQGTAFDPGYWYITTQEAQWMAWTIQKIFRVDLYHNIFFGIENGILNPLINAADLMIIGIILGAAFMALRRGEFKWRKPTGEQIIFALIGGTLMGIGARLALGCNIGALFVPAANGDYSGWLFFIAMGAGAFLGVKITTWWINRRVQKEFKF